MTKSKQTTGERRIASPSRSEDEPRPENADPRIAAISSLLRVQAEELDRQLLITQREHETTDRPNALQLLYKDDGVVEFAWSGGVELSLRVGGVDSIFSGEIAGTDYMNELSVASSDVTAKEEFWEGVSPAVPPWRFLWAAGQPADYTDHAGRDSLPGHLVERVLRDLVGTNAQSFRRRGKDGKRHLEWLAGESELGTEHASPNGRSDGVLNRLDRQHMLEILRGMPDFDLFTMQEEGLSQAQIAERKGVSQARVSQRMKQFKATVRDRFPSFRFG